MKESVCILFQSANCRAKRSLLNWEPTAWDSSRDRRWSPKDTHKCQMTKLNTQDMLVPMCEYRLVFFFFVAHHFSGPVYKPQWCSGQSGSWRWHQHDSVSDSCTLPPGCSGQHFQTASGKNCAFLHVALDNLHQPQAPSPDFQAVPTEPHIESTLAASDQVRLMETTEKFTI